MNNPPIVEEIVTNNILLYDLSCNPLEAEYTEYVNILKTGMTTDQRLTKLKLTKQPPAGIEIYQYRQ